MNALAAYERIVRDAAEDSNALAAFLIGSRATDTFDGSSDFDVCVVFADETSSREFSDGHPSRHGDVVEVITASMEELRRHGAYGSGSEWARAQYLDIRVLFDRTSAEFAAVIEEKRSVPDHVRRERLPATIDTFINSYFRSARNHALGLDVAARLDAVESVSPFLDAIFMLEGRVRPFNKTLARELERRPLRDPAWNAERLMPLLIGVCDGDISAQQMLFRHLERVARPAGFADVIEGWQPDVGWLRGEGAYRR